nr:hypothetical protein [Tanacetum cinerariifolium]
WSTGSSNPHNKEGDSAFDGKEHDTEKPESAVNLSPSTNSEDYSEDRSNNVSAASPIVPTAGQNYSNNTNPISVVGPSNTNTSPTHGKSSLQDASQPLEMLEREDIAYPDHENVGVEADFNNLETYITVSPIPTTRTNKDHPVAQIIGDLSLTTQTRSMTRVIRDQGGLSQIFNEDFHTCMFACFLLQEEPKRVHQALKDPSWIEAMQEELLQFKMQKVWILVDLPHGKRAIGHTQEEGIDYEEVFAPVARIEAIRLFLAYASFMGFMDPDHLDKVYKVVKALYGLHQAPRAWYETLAKYRLENGFHRGQIDQTLFIKKQKGESMGTHFLSGSSGKSASTPIDIEKPLLKEPDGEDVDVHIYISMIGSLMYLTLSRPDIMFAGKPHLGLWYPNDSPFDLVAYSDTDYAGASLDRKSTTGECQFLGCRLISWQCKKQTVVATSSIEAEYVAGASCCAQVLWIQNQMLDYGDALHLDDAEGVDCLPNEEIFTAFARMGYEKPSTKLTFYKAFFLSQWKFLIHTILQSMSAKHTSWNEFSLAMASTVICLSTGIEIPLFEGMLVVREPEEQGDAEEHGNDDNAAEEPVTAVDNVEDQSIQSPTPPTPPPQQPQDIPSTSHVQSPPPQQQSPTPAQPQGADFPMSLLQEALDACATLARRVEHLEHDKVAQDLKIIKLKTRVKKLEKTNKVKTLKLRRLRKVGTSQRVDTFDDTLMEDVSNQGRKIDELDRDEGAADIYHIDMDHATKVLSMQEDEPEIQEAVEVVTAAKLIKKVVAAVSETVSAAAVVTTAAQLKLLFLLLDEEEEFLLGIQRRNHLQRLLLKSSPRTREKRYQVMKKRPQTEAQARRNIMVYLKNTAGFRLDYFKGMSYDDIHLIFKAKFNANMEFLLKSKEQMEEEESKAIAIINETPAQKVAMRRRLNKEAKDVEELK